MKKKILFVITYLELGGAQKQLLSIINRLNPQKYSMHLCAGANGCLKKEFFRVKSLRIKFIPQLVRQISLVNDLIAFLKLYSYIRREHFDIVHVHSPKASVVGRWAAYLAGAQKIVYTVHGWPFHRFMNRFVYYSYLLLEKASARITDKIIVVSNADFNIGIKQRIAPKEKIVLVHYGVNTFIYEKVYFQRKVSYPLSIVTVSALKKQKGIFDFLSVADKLLKKSPTLNFVIFGDGPLRETIEKKIGALNLTGKVELKGWSCELSNAYQEAGIFLLTSLWEGLPVALIEAVLSGVPVVATNTGGVLDIVNNGKQGVILDCRAIGKIVDTCWNILKNYEEWSTIINNGRPRIDLSYWDRERMIKEVENIYREL